MAPKILALFLLCSITILSGCGQFNPINPPIVSAQTPPPANCDINGMCSQHIQTTWGDCDYATNQTAHTFSGTLETGINVTPANANDSLCGMFLANGGDLTSIRGDADYRSWGTSPASMIVQIRACMDAACTYPTGQEYLVTLKMTADPGSHVSIPFSARFDTPIHVHHFMVVFNDDLNQAKPTTISLGFSGTFR